jgi:hypothetical protein
LFHLFTWKWIDISFHLFNLRFGCVEFYWLFYWREMSYFILILYSFMNLKKKLDHNSVDASCFAFFISYYIVFFIFLFHSLKNIYQIINIIVSFLLYNLKFNILTFVEFALKI